VINRRILNLYYINCALLQNEVWNTYLGITFEHANSEYGRSA